MDSGLSLKYRIIGAQVSCDADVHVGPAPPACRSRLWPYSVDAMRLLLISGLGSRFTRHNDRHPRHLGDGFAD